MRVVIQRAGHASVTINGTCKASIGKGLMILVGIEESDGKEDIDWLCKKIVNLRIFDDENGVMNRRRDTGYQPVHPPRLHQERQPSLLHTGSTAGNIRPAVRTILPGTEFSIR